MKETGTDTDTDTDRERERERAREKRSGKERERRERNEVMKSEETVDSGNTGLRGRLPGFGLLTLRDNSRGVAEGCCRAMGVADAHEHDVHEEVGE